MASTSELEMSLKMILEFIVSSSSRRLDSCRIPLVGQLQLTSSAEMRNHHYFGAGNSNQPFVVFTTNVTALELKTNYDLDLLNDSHLIAKRKGGSPFNYPVVSHSYVTPIVSLLNCLLPPLVSSHHSEDANLSSSYSFSNSSLPPVNLLDIDQLLGAEMQPFLYVCSILFFFAIIFSLIMLFSYRFNRQDAEILESKMILKDWKSFKTQQQRGASKHLSATSSSSRVGKATTMTTTADRSGGSSTSSNSCNHQVTLNIPDFKLSPASPVITPNHHHHNLNKIVKFKIDDWSFVDAPSKSGDRKSSSLNPPHLFSSSPSPPLLEPKSNSRRFSTTSI